VGARWAVPVGYTATTIQVGEQFSKGIIGKTATYVITYPDAAHVRGCATDRDDDFDSDDTPVLSCLNSARSREAMSNPLRLERVISK